MPRLEVTPYESSGLDSAVVAVNSREVVLEAHQDGFSVSLQPGVSLSEAWANIAPSLSRPKPDSPAVCQHNIPGVSQTLTHGEVIDNMWEFSRNHELIDFIKLSLERHTFYWQTKGQYFGGKPEIGVLFKRFEPEAIRKVLSIGELSIVGATQDIMGVATALFKHLPGLGPRQVIKNVVKTET